MTQTAAPRARHVPLRTCLGCRAAKPKRDLVRIVRTAAGQAQIDETGSARGRGAYCCPNAACAARALRQGALNRALRTNLDPAALAALRAWAARLDAPSHPIPARRSARAE